jgi:hypothetical protein
MYRLLRNWLICSLFTSTLHEIYLSPNKHLNTLTYIMKLTNAHANYVLSHLNIPVVWLKYLSPRLMDCSVLVTLSNRYILLRDNKVGMQDAPCNNSCPADQQLQSTNVWYYENVLSLVSTLHIRLLLPMGQWITPHFSHLSTPNYVRSRSISDTIWHSYFCTVWQSDLLSCLSPRSGTSIIRCKINRESVFWSQEFSEKWYTSMSPQCTHIGDRQ